MHVLEFHRFAVDCTPRQLTIYEHLKHISTSFHCLRQSDVHPFVEQKWVSEILPVTIISNRVENTHLVVVDEYPWYPFASAATIATSGQVEDTGPTTKKFSWFEVERNIVGQGN